MTLSNGIDLNNQTIEAIKQQVAEQFRTADSSVRIKFTEYFNNTYSPDVILSWPSDQEDRAVFLRTNSDPRYLAEDVEILSSERSILLPLSSSKITEVAGPASKEVSLLETSAEKFKTLVAPADSIQELGTGHESKTFAGLISKAVLQGGKGLVRRNKAKDIVDDISAGFQDASEAKPEHIRGAVSTASNFLDDFRSTSITSFLQAMWLASGSDAEFPADVVALPKLSSSALRFLLEVEGVDNPEFWTRMSSNVGLNALVATGLTGSPANLDRLMSQGARVLSARMCRVIEVSKDEDSKESSNWFLKNGLLGLHLSGSAVVFSNTKISDVPVEGIDGATDVNTVTSRARNADISIRSLSISANETRIAYETTSESDIANDQKLAEIGDSLGTTAEVVSASVAAGKSARKIICNLATSTAHGQANAKFELSELALSALPILVDANEDELARLRLIFEDTAASTVVAVNDISDESGDSDDGFEDWDLLK
ncbi:hypothetical protein [Glutamicibacter sp. TV12E]|uniref:hypothetical protein n=1 Tax=Glutamicibacter sp. TV12E TaxID=3446362 RepID=UPI0040342E63